MHHFLIFLGYYERLVGDRIPFSEVVTAALQVNFPGSDQHMLSGLLNKNLYARISLVQQLHPRDQLTHVSYKYNVTLHKNILMITAAAIVCREKDCLMRKHTHLQIIKVCRHDKKVSSSYLTL